MERPVRLLTHPRSGPALPRCPAPGRPGRGSGRAQPARPGSRSAGCALQEGAESSYFLPKCQLPARDSLPPAAGSHRCHSVPGPLLTAPRCQSTHSLCPQQVSGTEPPPRGWLGARDGTPGTHAGVWHGGGDGTHSAAPLASLTAPSAQPWSRAEPAVSSPQPCSELRAGLPAPAHAGAGTEGRPRAAGVFYTGLWFPALAGRRQRPPARERAPSRSSVL